MGSIVRRLANKMRNVCRMLGVRHFSPRLGWLSSTRRAKFWPLHLLGRRRARKPPSDRPREKSRECGHGGAVTLAAAQKIRNEKIPSGSPFTLRTETLMGVRAMLAPLRPKTQSACRTPVENVDKSFGLEGADWQAR
jgi:hypothetical protein